MRAIDRVGPHASHVLEDPYAAWFLSPLARAGLEVVASVDGSVGMRPNPLPALTRYVQVRHRWMDDQFLAALDAGQVDQVVVLGAGYDMRAWRFADRIGGRPVFEVDYPSTAARKAAILATHRSEMPAIDVRGVTLDFQTQRLADVLVTAGFETSLRTFVFWEGVSMYLDRGAIDTTLVALRGLGCTHLVMDFWSEQAGKGLRSVFHRFAPAALRLVSEPVTFAVSPADVGNLFEADGWRLEEIADTYALAKRYSTAGGAYPGAYCVLARAA
jgi:methyltransferase (TIGR00027 family)